MLPLIDKIFEFSFRLMSSLPPIIVLSVFSLITAVLSLLIVRWTSNQQAIRRVKDRIGARVLEVRLFSDQPSVVLRAYFNLLGDTVLYLRYALVPLLILFAPFLLLYGQLEARFAKTPVEPGEDFLVTANFQAADSLLHTKLSLPPEILETDPPVRVPRLGEIDWKLQGRRAGAYDIHVDLQGQQFSKRVVIGTGLAEIVAERVHGGFWRQIVSPGELPLGAGSAVSQIRIEYPPRFFAVGGWQIGWIVPYVFFTLAAALLLKGALGVEI